MNMRITSRSAASRVAQSESVSQPGSVPVRVQDCHWNSLVGMLGFADGLRVLLV